MTRNYHRLWQRPHWPHRDPDVPDVPDVPYVPEEHVHLYSYQSDFYPEEFEYFETPSTLRPVWVSNPLFDHGVTNEYESCEKYDHQYRVTSADVDGPYDERELSAEESEPEPSDLNDSFDHGNNHDFDPREPYYANSENSDHFDPRNDYYYNDHSDGDYYHDDEDQFYPEDILINEFNRLDLEPDQDLEDYPNYGHGVVYPPDHGHSANKPTFFHADSNQEFHHDCHICADYMEDFYKTIHHDDTDSYSDNE